MNLIGRILIVSVVMYLVFPRFSRGCGDDVSAILDQLEQLRPESDAAEMTDLLRCLTKPAEKWIPEYDSFFSKRVLEEIEAETSEYRLRVYRILAPLRFSGDWLVAQEAIASLAYYGYIPAGQMLDGYPDGPKKAVLYAIVGHRKSYRWAIDQLLRIERSSDPEGDSHEASMTYLGLLFHLAEPLSLPFLNGLISSDGNAEVRARAELVRKHILELNPDLK